MKIEYEPLFSPGFHDIKIDEIEEIFSKPFPNSLQRKYLTQRFNAFLNELNKIGIDFEIWLDGSFSTMKPDPDDIDILLICNQSQVNQLDNQRLFILENIIKNRQVTKIRYGCDAYICYHEDVNMKSYWRGWFGFSRNDLAKRIPKIIYVCN